MQVRRFRGGDVGGARRSRRPSPRRGHLPARPKTCGDGLTPPRSPNSIISVSGTGCVSGRSTAVCGLPVGAASWNLPWPGGALPVGSAGPPHTTRRSSAADRGGRRCTHGAGREKPSASSETATGLRAVTVKTASGTHTVTCEKLIVADGVRSTLGKQLGRQWQPRHRVRRRGPRIRDVRRSADRDHVAPGAARRHRCTAAGLRLGVFPLATGEVNIGVGTLATRETSGKPGALRPLLDLYVAQRRAEWRLDGDVLPRGVGAAADGWRRLERRRAQLGADRLRRRVREPAQRRGHRLRTRGRRLVRAPRRRRPDRRVARDAAGPVRPRVLVARVSRVC